MEKAHYVTLDLTTHFLARGQAGSPLDAHVELVKQTRGHAFLQGVV
jgi:acyl-coenzyme A thioesterase PaaI-like protein